MTRKRRRETSSREPEPPSLPAFPVGSGPGRGLRVAAACAALLVLNAFVYAQVRAHEFVNLDDAQYVTDNLHVRGGLTLDAAMWAFSTAHAGNWHPLTWLSHMLDVSLFGLAPGAHHLTSAFLHAANTLLLFVLFARMTGALFRSALVAALFAVHPLHVESVAWVAERKDVLSTFFGLLALVSYVAYARRPGARRLVTVGLLTALSLMAKPMLVTLPLVMLLLDFWPLHRVEPIRRLIIEKLPLLALSLASSAVTLLVQRQAGAVRSFEMLPVATRAGNAMVSYLAYLGQTLWPANLAAFYPYPHSFPVWQVSFAALAFVLVTVLAIGSARRHPHFVVGWFWYVLTLLPVIGLIQVGSQSRADRYTYMPLIGIFVILAWGGAEILGPGRRRELGSLVAMLAITACGWRSREQASHWRNSVDLWRHAVRVTTDNPRAHHNLGHALAGQGDTDGAMAEYTEALRLDPRSAETHNNLGGALAESGHAEEAIPHYQEALRISPGYAEAQNNLGILLHRLFRDEEASRHLTEAVKLAPALAGPHNNLGVVLLGQGQAKEAAEQFREALRLEPSHADARLNLARAENALGVTSAESGKTDEAIAHWRKARDLAADLVEARVNLGRTLADLGRTDEAIRELSEAIRSEPSQADFHYDLGVLLNRQGRTGEALVELDAALRLDPNHVSARQARDALTRGRR